MAEYIDRKKIRLKTCGDCTRHIAFVCQHPEPCADLLGAFFEAEPEDVTPVVHGQWEHDHTDMVGGNFAVLKCSICGYKGYAIADHIKNGNYCPNCGAKMDGGEKHAQ